ncbi:MAG: epoxyqueuosine reductase QueH [Clostridia bacterium]|nr:epoxyqueuosine reductase QueH [Clostridia bacterium]
MEMKQNYQHLMEQQLAQFTAQNRRPRILLHGCCAPCASYVLEYLYAQADITMFFYNPNISPESEFSYRAAELNRLIAETGREIPVVCPAYDPTPFLQMAKGREHLPEGSERCYDCYALRLRAAADYAAQNGFDFFTTTLSISPHKNAEWLNQIGKALEAEYGVPYLYADFKKKNGYKRSIELSREYRLYRQDYCGCIFSKSARRSDAR